MSGYTAKEFAEHYTKEQMAEELVLVRDLCKRVLGDAVVDCCDSTTTVVGTAIQTAVVGADVGVVVSLANKGKSKEELSKVFDAEVEKFSQFMSKLGDWKAAGPLNDLERMLVKTYLVHKFAGHIDEVK